MAAAARDGSPRGERSARSRSGGPDEPLVITRLVKSALRIVAMDDAAHRLGLRVGMPLADARAMYPALAVATSDKEADRRLLEGVADWCDRYTPLVGLDAPDGLMLDIAGCAHLFGGETAMGRDMLKRLAAQGLQARAAIADTPGAAFAVARFGGASVVPPGAMRQALAPLPVAALRLSPSTTESLAELGLKHIADLIDLPRAPLAARFGEGLVRRLDQALGREDEPITPRLPVPSYVAEQRFPDPIGLERDVLGVITRLAARLGTAMERRQDGARLLQVALFRTDNKVYRIAVGTGAPVRDAARIAACSPTGWPRWATPAIRVSASTWCGSPPWWWSAASRCNPASAKQTPPVTSPRRNRSGSRNRQKSSHPKWRLARPLKQGQGLCRVRTGACSGLRDWSANRPRRAHRRR